MSENGFPLYGFDLFGEPVRPERSGALAQRFLVPPFTVLSAREGEWQDRKRAWLSLGIKSELGRDGNLLAMEHLGSGTSIFDPVLCELCYRWFCPPGGAVYDPFAGGSVRGIVAALSGLCYHGRDLSMRQVAHNLHQWGAFDGMGYQAPHWEVGDSCAADATAPACDFVFSCPPYGDLERYSDDPRDISTLPHAAFLQAYRTGIATAMRALAPNRFAAFVVGNFRAGGILRDFVGDTVQAFAAAGGAYYNDAVLVTQCGTMALRANRIFEGGRKLTRGHQYVLVFVKGDPKKATAAVMAEAVQAAPATNQGGDDDGPQD